MKIKDKIIVTGACGFIGSHLVDRLVELDYDVYGIDDLSAESNDQFYFNDGATYIKRDINELYEVDYKIFKHARAIFHLAAESRIGPAIKNPLKATTTNVLGTTRLLELAREFKVDKFIYSSTSSVYGNTTRLPTNSNCPIDCLNPYSATKYCGEEMVRMYSKMFGLKTCVFRYFNVFGERSPTKGQYAPVIGLFLKARAESKKIKIVGNGQQRRDFVHVSDVVQANISAIDMDPTYPWNGHPLNIGSGENLSINEIAAMISPKIEYIPQRIGEAQNTLADLTLAKTFLSFKPMTDVKTWINKQIDA